MSEYKYNNIKIDGKIRISPSNFAKSLSNPSKWYDEAILGLNDFRGNTATVLGTILHKRAEFYALGKDIDINAEVDFVASFNDNPDVDAWKIFDEEEGDLEPSYEALLEQYLKVYPKPDDVEKELIYEPKGVDYFIGGSVDAREGTTVIDFKTTSKAKKEIEVTHRIQLLVYSFLYKMNGQPIDKMRVVYIQHKTKTLPPRVYVLEADITEDDMLWIETMLRNTVKKLKMVAEDKSMLELLFTCNPMARY